MSLVEYINDKQPIETVDTLSQRQYTGYTEGIYQ